jgi:hypothetical protein
MNKKRIKYLTIGLGILIAVSGFVVYKTVINPEHREISKETTDFTVPAKDLQFHFAGNPNDATIKYIDKVIETNGLVTELGANTLVLENKVQVYFLNDIKSEIRIGDHLKVKGRCVGFDELLALVKIDQATTLIN